MKKTMRVALAGAALAASVALATPSEAQGQVRVEGRFRLPHGDIAIGVGDPYYGGPYGYHRYPVGSYVPYGYRVHRRARYGYGFESPAFACRVHGIRHAHWVPVRRYRTRWIVVERPYVVERYVRDGRYDDRYDDGYYNDGYYDDGYYRDRPNRSNDFSRQLWDRDFRNPYRRHVHTADCRH